MAEGKQREKQRYVDLRGRSTGKATVGGKLTVTRFGEYLVNRRVGISSDEAHELQGYVDRWTERGLSEAEAWSLIISVEAWAQARKAFWVAIGVGLLSILVAIGIGLLSVAAQVIAGSGG